MSVAIKPIRKLGIISKEELAPLNPEKITMTVEEYEERLTLSYLLGGMEKEFNRKAGECYANGLDEKAQFFREQAQEFKRRAEELRKAYDEKSKALDHKWGK